MTTATTQELRLKLDELRFKVKGKAFADDEETFKAIEAVKVLIALSTKEKK